MRAFSVEGNRFGEGPKAVHALQAEIAPLTVVVVLDCSASVSARSSDQQFREALLGVLRAAADDWPIVVMRLGDPVPLLCGPIRTSNVTSLFAHATLRDQESPSRHRASLLRPVVEQFPQFVTTGRALVLIYSDGELQDIAPIPIPANYAILGMATSMEGTSWKTRWPHVLGNAPFVHDRNAFTHALRRLHLAWDGQAKLELVDSDELEVLARGAWRPAKAPHHHDFRAGPLYARTPSQALLSLEANDGTKVEVVSNPALAPPEIASELAAEERAGVRASGAIARVLPSLDEDGEARVAALVPDDLRGAEHLLVALRSEADGRWHGYFVPLAEGGAAIDDGRCRLTVTWVESEWVVRHDGAEKASFRKGRHQPVRSAELHVYYWPGAES